MELPPSLKVEMNGEPIQLLNYNPDGTVTVMESSLEKLFFAPEVCDREVVIISIAGALRKGKSFLLNYMLRYLHANYKSIDMPNKVIDGNTAKNWLGDENEPLKGFPWKSSTQPETIGILFWSNIFLYDSPNGDKIAIYLVDTQGLFDHFSSPTDNVRIFSLTMLISSIQILNMFNNLQESDLEYLQFATEIARFTALDDNSAKPFQKLLYIVRDWSSPIEYDYGLEGGSQFINNILKIREFHNDELKEVRKHIQRTFESIGGCLMPHPGKKVIIDPSYDGRWSEIDEDFVEIMQQLIPTILAPNNLVLKSVNGATVKGYQIGFHIQQYVDLFKSEILPEAKSIYESTLDNQIQILLAESVEMYLTSVEFVRNNNSVNYGNEEIHKISKETALKYFNGKKIIENEQEISQIRDELIEKIEMMI